MAVSLALSFAHFLLPWESTLTLTLSRSGRGSDVVRHNVHSYHQGPVLALPTAAQTQRQIERLNAQAIKESLMIQGERATVFS
jgi:hypothetical protein